MAKNTKAHSPGLQWLYPTHKNSGTSWQLTSEIKSGLPAQCSPPPFKCFPSPTQPHAHPTPHAETNMLQMPRHAQCAFSRPASQLFWLLHSCEVSGSNWARPACRHPPHFSAVLSEATRPVQVWSSLTPLAGCSVWACYVSRYGVWWEWCSCMSLHPPPEWQPQAAPGRQAHQGWH